MEVINHLLSPGGIWLNVGPLLWHYECSGSGGVGAGAELSIELTLEEIQDLLPKLGFEMLEQRQLDGQTYTGNERNMLRYEYHPEFWVARKVRDVGIAPEV